MTDSEIVLLYSTFPDMASARAVARALIEAKLAACVNILPPVTSVYEWQGRVETDVETVAFIKTQADLADAAIDEARKQHPYEVPCFLKLPIDGGNADYLEWVRGQTKAQ